MIESAEMKAAAGSESERGPINSVDRGLNQTLRKVTGYTCFFHSLFPSLGSPDLAGVFDKYYGPNSLFSSVCIW